jgi:hypothetical protein
MRARLGDALLSIGALAILLIALVCVDDRVREQISLRLSDHPSAQLETARVEVQGLSSVLFRALRDQSIDHAPLMIFVFSASVLFIFMIRT